MSRSDIQSKLMKNPRYAAQIAAKTGGQDHIADASKMVEKRPRKYHNEPTEANGERFDSKHEARVYASLVAVYGASNVIRQVSIPIGSRRIRPDFLVIHKRFDDGSFRGELVDAKGMATEAWTAKANHLFDKHGLRIRIV